MIKYPITAVLGFVCEMLNLVKFTLESEKKTPNSEIYVYLCLILLSSNLCLYVCYVIITHKPLILDQFASNFG